MTNNWANIGSPIIVEKTLRVLLASPPTHTHRWMAAFIAHVCRIIFHWGKKELQLHCRYYLCDFGTCVWFHDVRTCASKFFSFVLALYVLLMWMKFNYSKHECWRKSWCQYTYFLVDTKRHRPWNFAEWLHTKQKSIRFLSLDIVRLSVFICTTWLTFCYGFLYHTTTNGFSYRKHFSSQCFFFCFFFFHQHIFVRYHKKILKLTSSNGCQQREKQLFHPDKVIKKTSKRLVHFPSLYQLEWEESRTATKAPTAHGSS